MNRSIAAELRAAVDNEEPRDERARAAAAMILEAGDYRGVGIYDVGDERATVIGSKGALPQNQRDVPIAQGLDGEAVRTRAAVAGDSEAIVPILGAESGVVIGTLAVDGNHGAPSKDEIAFLEDCAAALRPLYD
jgi:putative methionine-R-sulfoxide reductase with GAF domain